MYRALEKMVKFWYYKRWCFNRPVDIIGMNGALAEYEEKEKNASNII